MWRLQRTSRGSVHDGAVQARGVAKHTKIYSTVPISTIKIELPLASQKDTRNQTADINLHAKVTDTAPLHHLLNLLLGVGSLQRNRRQARVSTLD